MEMLSIVSSLGSIPLLILLLALLIIQVKEHKKQHLETSQKMEDIQKSFSTSLQKIVSEFNSSMVKLEARIVYIEQNYAEKSYVQEAVSGWRTEIQELGRRIDGYNKRIDRVMEIKT